MLPTRNAREQLSSNAALHGGNSQTDGTRIMQLSKQQIEQYREEGYLTFREFFTDKETAAIRTELEHLLGQGRSHNVSTDEDGATHSKTKQNLQIVPLSPHSRLFRSLPWQPKVNSFVPQLIGDPVLRHLDQCFWKPARSGAPTNWHQDNAYFHATDPLHGVGMWTAVHEATAANGTMRIIPGSHKREYEHTRDPNSDHHVRAYPDEDKAVHIELPAGGVLFFNYGVLHATGRNETDKPRAGLAYHFLNPDYAPEGFNGRFGEDRLLAVTGPDATGGESEFGERVDNAWAEEVERVLSEHATA
jgi:ectoine hydroxylase-related dioxygenase (phytanoyl-CoA dioxygenase family)